MSYRAPRPRRRPLAGLGQAKGVPGQLSFAALPPGVTAPPNFQRLQEAGLPIAPYIEHGSWVTGEPDIMRYGLDPYRGIMGLGGSFGYDPATNTSWGGCVVDSWPATRAAADAYARSIGRPSPKWLGGGIAPPTRERIRAAAMGDTGDGLGCTWLDRLLGRAPSQAPATPVPAATTPSGVLPASVDRASLMARSTSLGTGTVTCGGQVIASNVDYSTGIGLALGNAQRTGQPCTLTISGGSLGTRTLIVGPDGSTQIVGSTRAISGMAGITITQSQLATILLTTLGAAAGLSGNLVRNKWLAAGLGAGLGFMTGKIMEPPRLPAT